MLQSKSNVAVAAGLIFAIALWGGNNTGTKWLVSSWPPTFTGGTRFRCAGFILLTVLRGTKWLGKHHVPPRELLRPLWVRGWLAFASLAIFMYGLSMVLFFYVLQHLPVTVASALFYLVPVFGILLAAGFLGERLTPIAIAGTAIVLVSTILIMKLDKSAV